MINNSFHARETPNAPWIGDSMWRGTIGWTNMSKRDENNIRGISGKDLKG
jgi:hypothetical protein